MRFFQKFIKFALWFYPALTIIQMTVKYMATLGVEYEKAKKEMGQVVKDNELPTSATEPSKSLSAKEENPPADDHEANDPKSEAK